MLCSGSRATNIQFPLLLFDVLFMSLSVTEIEQMVFVSRFSAPSTYWMMIRFWFGACTGISSVPASFQDLCQVVKWFACVSTVPAYYWFCFGAIWWLSGKQGTRCAGSLWHLQSFCLLLERQIVPWLMSHCNGGVLGCSLLGHVGFIPEQFSAIA